MQVKGVNQYNPVISKKHTGNVNNQAFSSSQLNKQRINNTISFLHSILDTVSEHIVVIRDSGEIQYVNRGWVAFGHKNNCTIDSSWIGINYLAICDEAASRGDEFGLNAAQGIRNVISNTLEDYYLEYPCHSTRHKRWFMMRVTPFELKNERFFVISHQNITERKLAEEEILNLSRTDSLTGIANRRYLDEFLATEWKRSNLRQQPLSFAFIDLDHFKLLNDTYGHQAGDNCLRQVGYVLKNYTRRPADLSARYGGEEFVVLLGNTHFDDALVTLNNLATDIQDLNIPNEKSPVSPVLTASIGLVSVNPGVSVSQECLVEEADKLLFTAKHNGRNRLVHKTL